MMQFMHDVDDVWDDHVPAEHDTHALTLVAAEEVENVPAPH